LFNALGGTITEDGGVTMEVVFLDGAARSTGLRPLLLLSHPSHLSHLSQSFPLIYPKVLVKQDN